MKKKRGALVLIIVSLICIILNIIFEFDVSNIGFWLRNTAFVSIIIANIMTINQWKSGQEE